MRLALLPLLFAAAAVAQAPAPIHWHTDFATARAIAERTDAPLLVTFRCER